MHVECSTMKPNTKTAIQQLQKNMRAEHNMDFKNGTFLGSYMTAHVNMGKQHKGESRLAAGCKGNSFQSFTLCEGWEVICVVNPEVGYKLTSLQGSSSGSMTRSREEELTRVKLFGEAAQRLMLVKFHSWITSLVFSSTLITLSLVMPSRRGTSLFLPFIFSWRRFKGTVRMFLLESKWSKKQRSGTRELHSHP